MLNMRLLVELIDVNVHDFCMDRMCMLGIVLVVKAIPDNMLQPGQHW